MDGQSVAVQVATRKAAGADKGFKDVVSGAKTNRAQLHVSEAATARRGRQ